MRSRWLPLTDKRITCVCGHTFTPDATLSYGEQVVTCRRCGAELVILASPRLGRKIVAEVPKPLPVQSGAPADLGVE